MRNMDQQRLQKTTRRRRGAVLSVELVMALPILLFILLAFVEFGLLLMSQQGLAAASSLGAREASLTGATKGSVNARIDAALQGWSWQADRELAVFVTTNTGMSSTTTKVNFSTSPSDDPIKNAKTGDRISVSVNVEQVKAAPNLLKWIGIDLANPTGKVLTTTYVTRKE